jgi:hypothetical protein
MKYLFFFIIQALCIAQLFASEDRDKLPGSRSLYVKNHGKDECTLILGLRNCICNKEEFKENTFCRCWVDFRDEDQPNIQGDAKIAIYLSLKYGAYFLSFFAIPNNDVFEKAITVPTPEFLLKILNSFGLDKYFELVDGIKPLGVDSYLKLLAKGKIPIAKIPKENEVKDTSLLYHNYFHDLFNHMFIWMSFPNSLRFIIQHRTKKFIKLLAKLEKKFEKSPKQLSLLRLMKFYFASNFDTSMGSLNNNLINSDQTEFDKDDINNLRIYIERTVNFGLFNKNISNESIFTNINSKMFLMYWFKIYGNTIKSNIKKYKFTYNENHINNINSIKRDSKTYEALKLLLQSPNEVKLSLAELQKYAAELLGFCVDEDLDFKDNLICLKAFIIEVDEKLKEVIQKYSNFLKSYKD